MNGHALIIQVSRYQHMPVLPLVADAAALASVLSDASACGYDPEHVVLLQDSEATRERILDELGRMARRAGGDTTAIVYFSGHGGRSAGDCAESYLMPVDAVWESREQLDTSAISGRLLARSLDAVAAERLLVILDCCHAAGVAQRRDVSAETWCPDFTEDGLARLSAGRGRVVMAASRHDGSAFVLGGARHGLFTEHLIAGLRGAAGRPDGLVRVLDLYHHVQRNVVARQPEQRPVLKTQLEDNFPVARWSTSAALLTATSPPSGFAYDVLVVNSRDERDAAWALFLVGQLEDNGVRACIENRDAELGGMRLPEIQRLVSTSRFTLPVLTPRFTAGRFEALQTVMAMHLGVEQGKARLIPVVREPCEAELHLRMLVSLDMTRDENVVPGIQRLVRALRTPA